MNQYKQKGNRSGGGGIIFGIGCALLVSIISIMTGAGLVNGQILPESCFKWLSLIIPFIGVLSGTFAQNMINGNINFVPTLVIGGVYVLILLAACIMFFDSCFIEIWRQFAGVLAGMIPPVLHRLGIVPTKKPKYRYRK